MKSPLVSVGIPYTNQGPLLAEAIQSVLEQTFHDFELILFGDHPDEETYRIAHSFSDERIQHFVSGERRGLAVTLNEITSISRGEYIARMDGDDIMHPDRLQQQVTTMKAHPDLELVGTRAFLIDENTNLVGTLNEPPLPTTPKGFLESHAFTHPTVFGRREWFLSNRYDESLLRGQDKELWLRAGPKSSLLKMDDRLLYYRINRQLSWRSQARNSSYDRKIISQHANLSSPIDVLARKSKSLIKQILVFLLIHLGMTSRIYNSKFRELSVSEFSSFNSVLTGIRSRAHSCDTPILAITVTYGKRFHFVEKTVRSALTAGVTEVVIVDNGTAREESEELASYYADAPNVKIHRLNKNEGSASGFGAGLSWAMKSTYDLYLLLDDDNFIINGHVQTLASRYVSLRTSHGAVGISAVRQVNSRHQAVLSGEPHSTAYPPAGSFIYFDLFSKVRKQLSRHFQQRKKLASAPIPAAPYGGLLVDRNTVDMIGLPNTALGLYEDDTEWTSRIADRGVLILDSSVAIEDQEGKFSETVTGTGPERLLAATDQRRVYFAVRNRVFWEVSRLTGRFSRIRYILNKTIYLTVVAILARRRNYQPANASLRSAVRAGETGDLRQTYLVAGDG